MQTLKGKVILITWASWDIWRACAVCLSNAWAELLLHAGSSHERLLETISLCRENSVIDSVVCDWRNEKEISVFFRNIRSKNIKLDGLINNAWGLLGRKKLQEMDWSFFVETFELNVAPTFFFTRYAIDLMQNPWSILMISSMTARWWRGDRSSAYGMAKWAILWWMKSLANELWPIGVTVNALTPWFIEWAFHKKHTKISVATEHAINNPMGRVGRPEDVAIAALFYMANPSIYVNGTTLDINGWSYMS
jgi:3-oxoacyl-[acyl-carrier protein] reductase